MLIIASDNLPTFQPFQEWVILLTAEKLFNEKELWTSTI